MKSIALQGNVFSFHHLAAQKQFGQKNHWLHCLSFDELLQKVATKKVDKGIIAVENSLVGQVANNYQAIQDYGLSVIGKVVLPIELHLAASKGTALSEIREAYSHPVALKESSYFLDEQKQMIAKEFSDTAGAIKWVASQENRKMAAIGGIEAIRHYGLEAVATHIHNHKNNFTTFLAVQ